ncbi:hypothetical protein TSAR_012703 [Trichomalopsis sarcophagae]|uniref:Uncharacterized protein n=1 Tax=Trichomalopsis sarcophagae TaxID=543379 RepID=A0A232EEX5_9HYME|nr:hypothetical protein TSAR_012703 [Trichomalopsis sarcophagae]
MVELKKLMIVLYSYHRVNIIVL